MTTRTAALLKPDRPHRRTVTAWTLRTFNPDAQCWTVDRVTIRRGEAGR